MSTILLLILKTALYPYIAIFVIFQMAAAIILIFQKFEILMVFPLQGANMRHCAKFHQNRSNGCKDVAI